MEPHAKPTPNARSSAAPARLDRASFSAAYREVYPTLVVVARAEGARDEAEDVAQRAAIVALERLDRFELGSNFRAWMAAIVRGVARNHRRGRKRMDERHLRLAAEVPRTENQQSDAQTDAPRVYVTGDSVRVDLPDRFHADLRNAMDSLGPVQSACLVLKAVHGHSYDEISAMLDIPIATARSHVFRARGALASAMEQGRRASEQVAPGGSGRGADA